ncbi:aldo/keto reductase [Brevibacillus laterosporus]|uniref:Putative oxidoreductase n=1 Tax=Brevibacillus laterosporus LMG 15441 TaxID=1042163 RepID=A0A075R5T9_BRELA|nr:aldo/keto reductase [Brevibacillus laterosporus]AIG26801.1 putative oxidoreductase [Brevibacillus laterosporus LMG 15441]RJL06054.1 aldo/keto reductase [Brevibacillus laterosporus]
MNFKKICFGTWQFEKSFNKVTKEDALNLLEFAIDLGIRNIDTALAYEDGEIERLISKTNVNRLNIITKIPAKTKPSLQVQAHISEYYDIDWIESCVRKSINNLNCYPNTFLLHNWSDNWISSLEILDYLRKLKEKGYCEKIGISLPNSYCGNLSDTVLQLIDIVEVPYNDNDQWVLSNKELLTLNKVEIITRSLFKQGNLIPKENKDLYIREKIRKAAIISDLIAIGMTNKEQVKQNIDFIIK